MEFYRIGNSCGKGFVYTDEDLEKRDRAANTNALSAVAQLAGSLSGNWGGTIANKLNETELRDFTKCPFCGSHDLRTVSQQSFQQHHSKAESTVTASAKEPSHFDINSNATTDTLLKRVELFLEDQEWDVANAYCEKILDVDPTNSTAYLYKLMVESKVIQKEDLLKVDSPLSQFPSYKKVIRFGKGAFIEKLITTVNEKTKREEEIRKNGFKFNGLITSGNGFVNITYGVTSYGTLVCSASKADKPTRMIIPTDRYYYVKAISGIKGEIAILKEDGTVCIDGESWWETKSKYDLSSWCNIIQIGFGSDFIVGLKADGTVQLSKNAYTPQTTHDWNVDDVTSWKDIKQIVVNDSYVLGLTSNGSVVACGDGSYGRTNVSNWKDIIMVAAGKNFAYGLKKDGTVITTPSSSAIETKGENKVNNWSNIIQISAYHEHVLGLRRDGTVVSAGANDSGECNVEGWSNIIWVFAHVARSFGIKSDGTVVAVGDNNKKGKKRFDITYQYDNGPLNVNDWKLFDNYDQYFEEKKKRMPGAFEMIQRRKKEEEIKKVEREKGEKALKKQTLEMEKGQIISTLSTLKGIFTSSKRSKLQTRLSEIEKEISRLTE